MMMAIDPNLFRAILAMDAYNRGYNPGIKDLSDAEGMQIGKAHIYDAKGDAAAQAAGFYALAYDNDRRRRLQRRRKGRVLPRHGWEQSARSDGQRPREWLAGGHGFALR
jgi:hypothetical protein